jgi:hypothetical protein
MNSIARLVATIAVVGSAAGLASAQQTTNRTLSRWSADAPATQNSTSSSTLHVRSSGDGDDYELIVKDGEIKAKINGKSIPSDRVRQTPEGYEILDEKGEVLKAFRIAATAPAAPIAPRSPFAGSRNNAFLGQSTNPPKVMIGITMTNSEEAEGVLVASVVDGLPAEKAGIQADDRIVRLGDEKVENEGQFRSILRNLNPGDTVKVAVVRDDKELVFDVTLDAFDQSRLGTGMSISTTEPGEMMDLLVAPGHDHEQLMDSVRESLKNIKNLSDEDRERINKTLESALANHAQSPALSNQRWLTRIAPQGNVWTIPPGEEGQAMAFAVAPDAPNADVSKKLDKLMKKIDSLEKRLAELQEQLEKANGGR